jgi:hypothetical protein
MNIAGTTVSPTIRKLKPRVIWNVKGKAKTGKNNFAYTAPGVIMDHRFDPGSEGVAGKFEFTRDGKKRLYQAEYKSAMLPVGSEALSQDALKAIYKPEIDQFDRNLRATYLQARTTVWDTDSDLWEIQRLAKFGKIVKIMPLQYSELNRQVIEWVRLFEQSERSNLIILSQAGDEWVDSGVLGPDGQMGRKKSGKLERRGSDKIDFLVQAYFNTNYTEAILGPQGQVIEPAHFSIELVRSSTAPELIGMKWYDANATFFNVATMLYPSIPAEEWMEKL